MDDMASFIANFRLILNNAAMHLKTIPGSESSDILKNIIHDVRDQVIVFRYELRDVQATHMLIVAIGDFQDELKKIIKRHERAHHALVVVLLQIDAALTQGLAELQRHSNYLEEMSPIIAKYLIQLGTLIQTYEGESSMDIRSIGYMLNAAGHSLSGGHAAPVYTGMEWHAIGRIADLLIQTMPHTNDAMRLATS
jgi:hypothetical protein